MTESTSQSEDISMIQKVINTPWKVQAEIIRWLSYPGARLLFAFYRIPWGSGWCFHGTPIIQKHRQSKMSFGSGMHLRSSVRSNPLGPNHPVMLCTWQKGSCLQVGEHFAMTGGSICAFEEIIIGNHVAVGANSIIVDTDFHPLDPAIRRLKPNCGETAPVIIEDDVFIGMNCLILKGVTIGKGSVIGAGSVVTRDIPRYVIAAGNPSHIVRELPHHSKKSFP